MGKQWDADIVLTETTVRTLLSTQFPELGSVEVQSLDAGWDNSVFLVNGNYVFRFPRRKVAVELIETENRLLPWLASQLPLLIPNPCFTGIPTREYPFPFSGYLKINGVVPHKIKPNDKQRAQASLRLAEFLRVLHSLPIHTAVDLGIPTSDYIGRMDIEKRIPMFRAKVEEACEKGLIEKPQALLSELSDLAGLKWNRQENRVVVHGDLNFRNFLVDRDGTVTGVIDWGDTHIGHPAIDLSLVYSYLPAFTRPDFFKRYGEVHPETLLFARFRALYVNIVMLLYAHDIGDTEQLIEAQRALLNAVN